MHALLFSDIVDSTALSARLGDAAAAELWARHDRGARDLLARHRGREIDRSDGFFLIFDTVADAAAYAAGYHAALAPLGLQARVGLHWGEVTLRRNRDDDVAAGAKPIEVDGLAKPLAARIMSLAPGGRTLASAAAAAELPASVPRQPLGHWRLKGLVEPIELVELARAPAAPPADGDKAYRVVESGDGLWLPRADVPRYLPHERDVFVGRQRELAALAQRVQAGERLVTLLGPGGSGKTRLAVRLARAWLGEWPGGAWFCDLSDARNADDVAVAVAAALGVTLGRGRVVEQLGHAIAARGRCLVVLDNAEQAVAAVAAAAGAWLDAAPAATLLVTSRERLHVRGEQVLEVPPLPLDGDALRLFEVRARAQREDFVLDDGNRAAVAEAVRLLDGLPLAIELAAARVRLLTPQQIVQRLSDRFALLAGARGPGARQATLRAAIDWSWDLLQPWEQAALAQVAVFEGGFTLPAAEAVIDLAPWPEAPPVLDVVQALVDKSLLRVWFPNGAWRLDVAETHYGLYLSIRDYAAERLQAYGDAARAQAHLRHAHCYARLGTYEAIRALSGPGGTQRRLALTIERDNLVLACRRALAANEGEMAAACYRAAWAVLQLRGPFDLALELGRAVRDAAGLTPQARALALLALAMAAREAGVAQEVGPAAQEALRIARAAQDRHLEGMALGRLAVMHDDEARYDESDALYRQALACLADEPRSAALRAVTMSNHAAQLFERGRLAEARAGFEDAVALHRAQGNRHGEGVVLGNLAELMHLQGERAPAHAAFEASVQALRDAGSTQQEAVTLGNLAGLLQSEGDLDAAAAQLGRARELLGQGGSRRNEAIVLAQLGGVHAARGEPQRARDLLEQALAMHRSAGDRRHEGETLGRLGVVLAALHRHEEALQHVRDGERLLRESGDPLGLAQLLCAQARVALAVANAAQAHAALQEAAALAQAAGAEPGSELVREIAAVRTLTPGPEAGAR